MVDMSSVRKCPTGMFPVNGECRQVPYGDKVKFYVDNKNKTIITTHIEDQGKGWHDVRVGNHHTKTRGYEGGVRNDLLRKYYPNHDDEISLFSELSYHSSLTQGEAGKIGSYGTSDYTKDFSKYKKIARYKLLQPVKTRSKREFGKEKKAVDVHKWRYIVIDWIPTSKDKPVKLQVKDSVKDPVTGKDEVLFKSREIPLSKKQEAFKLFNKRVALAKKW